MALTMVITGFWDVTPCNLPIFTGGLEKPPVSIFGVEDVCPTCIFLTNGQTSIKSHEDMQLKTFSSQLFSALYREKSCLVNNKINFFSLHK